MNINGLQKLTLLDYPGRTACTVFLAGCDMRCPFCHNSELISGNAPVELTDTDLLEFLKKRKGLLDGVAFTGGEPTLRRELPDLMKKIKDMGYSVKLDTNGNHPDMLKHILDNGLADYVAMDIKNSPERYAQTIGLDSFDMEPVYKSIELLLSSGIDFEFRTTVVDQLHDEESFTKIGPMIEGAPRYFLQPFTDRDSVIFSGFTPPQKEKLEKYASIVSPFVGSVEIRGLE
ncbi:MAG: anaerobic ribonucleoside-triphosphate reductase activating protein [Firmicutes bacterium]|nr:anaerobic ribonucleoside-triphosphate reductase activating protein [Bacillota bacterium]MBR6025789.1 anaerobic ribonucleoside-triphosphate reductase activating protein [Bacillota bacterium]